jgi:hypothetical protein
MRDAERVRQVWQRHIARSALSGVPHHLHPLSLTMMKMRMKVMREEAEREPRGNAAGPQFLPTGRRPV